MTRLLDLYCGAGGAAKGYFYAGFDKITGVDIKRQRHYPYRFLLDDALAYVISNMDYIRANYDLIHASPPCQAFSKLKAVHRDIAHPDLIDRTRQLLIQTGLPYIIENVPGAPLHNPIMLCGTMFNLQLFRHRCFEIGQGGQPITIITPAHYSHEYLGLKAPKTSRAPDYSKGEVHSIYGHFSDVDRAKKAMGVPWMSRNEMSQAIPPAYTQYIGERLYELGLFAYLT